MSTPGFDSGTFPIADYVGGDAWTRTRLLPSSGGIYCWVHDPLDWTDDDPEAGLARLEELLGRAGPRRGGKIRPYIELSLVESRLPFTDTKRPLIKRLLSEKGELRAWLAFAGSWVQRPLYLGLTNQLQVRLDQHLQQGSPLRTRLESAGVDPLRCRLNWITPSEGAAARELAEDDLKALESILIRLSMPLFNIKQE